MKTGTKRKLKQTARNFSLQLLEALKELAELIPRPLESKYEHQKRLWRYTSGYPPLKISQGIYHLKRQGLIEKKTLQNKIVYELTITGRHKLLMAKVARHKFNPHDGTSCVIIFDIPEQKAKHRRFLRRFLLNNGFTNLQKSVMIGPEFLPKEFYEFLSELELRPHVTVIKGIVQRA